MGLCWASSGGFGVAGSERLGFWRWAVGRFALKKVQFSNKVLICETVNKVKFGLATGGTRCVLLGTFLIFVSFLAYSSILRS